MSKKIDERIPQNSGEGANFKNYYGIQSPWNRIYSYQDALHYASRLRRYSVRLPHRHCGLLFPITRNGHS